MVVWAGLGAASSCNDCPAGTYSTISGQFGCKSELCPRPILENLSARSVIPITHTQGLLMSPTAPFAPRAYIPPLQVESTPYGQRNSESYWKMSFTDHVLNRDQVWNRWVLLLSDYLLSLSLSRCEHCGNLQAMSWRNILKRNRWICRSVAWIMDIIDSNIYTLLRLRFVRLMKLPHCITYKLQCLYRQHNILSQISSQQNLMD